MKILQVHNFYRRPGGEDAVVAAERGLLQSHGHQVVQYLKHNSEVKQLSGLQLTQKAFFNVEAEREVQDLLDRELPDLIHAHNTFPLISPAVYFAAARARIPVIQTLHNFRLLCPSATLFRAGRICEDCVGHVPYPAVLHGCYRGNRAVSAVTGGMITAHRALGTWSDRIHTYIALSEFSRAKFIQGGLPAGKIAVKSNFLPQDPGPGDGSGGYAFFAGRLSPEKGLGVLLNAWERLRLPIPLKIAGDGELMSWLQQQAARAPNVEVLGHRDPREVLQLIKQAALLIMPSEWYEAGVPLTIIEAFGCGTPVVTSDLPSMDNIVVNGVNGYQFAMGCPDALADQMENLWRAPQSLIQMRQSARATYEYNFSPDINYSLLREIYQRAMEPLVASKVSGTNICPI